MISRVLILVVVSVVFGLTTFAIWSLDHIAAMVPLGACLLSVYGIYRAIRDHLRFSLVDDLLILEAFGQRAQMFDLKLLVAWRELSYNIRGQRRKTLVLHFENGSRTSIDNVEYHDEYENVSRYLGEKFQSRKQETK